MKRIFFAFFALFVTVACMADDSIWVYKKAFVETYHIDRNCPVIIGKKVVAYTLSDETDARQRMRNALQLADNCTICKTPNIRQTRDNRLDQVLADALSSPLSMEDDEDDSEISVPFTDASLFDDEVVAGLPEGGKIKTSIFRTRGHRFKMLEVKKACDERLVGSTVVCEVVDTRKSNMMGAEGILTFRPLYLMTEDGTIIRLKPQDFTVRGKNRQNLKFWTFPTVVSWFIPGQGARIKPTDEFVLTLDPTAEIAADTLKKRELEKIAEEEKAAAAAKEEEETGIGGGAKDEKEDNGQEENE